MKKILIVDDEIDLLLYLKRALSGYNYDIATTVTCSEGLTVFKKFQPDLVLLDINVGDEDGREMCKTIKEGADSSHIPVILFSADHAAVRNHALHGAIAGIEKPYAISEVIALVRKILD